MSFYFAFMKISKGKSYMDVVVYLTNFYEESHLHPYSRLNFAIKVEKWSLFFVLIFSYLVLNKDQLKLFGPSQFFTTTNFFMNNRD